MNSLTSTIIRSTLLPLQGFGPETHTRSRRSSSKFRPTDPTIGFPDLDYPSVNPSTISRIWPRDPHPIEKIEFKISTNRPYHRIPRPRLPFGQPFYNFEDLAQRPTPDREDRVQNFDQPTLPSDSPTSITLRSTLLQFRGFGPETHTRSRKSS